MSKGRKKKIKLGENTVKIGINTYPRLDKFLPKIIKDFSQKPDKEFGKIKITTFNNNEVYLWNINNKASMSIEDVCFYIEAKYDTVYRAYYRHTDILKEAKDYFYVERAEFAVLRPSLQNVKMGKKLLFFTLHGLLILLRYIKVGLAEAFYGMWVDIICDLIETKQLSVKGQLFLMDKTQKLIPQILGDPKKNWVDKAGNRLVSRGEMILSNILLDLKVSYQIYSPVWPTEELMKKYNYHSKHPLQPDFLIKTIPKTIIEYWGREGDSTYDFHREWKTKIYQDLKIRLIEIEPYEVQNIPILKVKLIKELKIEV
jgi:hypothetical protein